MSLARSLRIIGKDLRLGPRSAIFLWALVLPVFMTLVVQVAFASLFDPVPRLGIVDEGSSRITEQARRTDGIEVTVLDDPEELKRRVESNDLDAGLVLQAGFDDAVRSGERPELQFYIGGESLASNRVILSVTAIDLVREVEGREAPVEVRIEDFGAEEVPIATRLVPLLVMYALVMAGVYLTASSFVEEREQHTLDAVLVGPTRLSEVLLAKGVFGFTVAAVMAFVTLALNRALGGEPAALLLSLAAGAFVSTMLGLVFATAAKDTQGLFALVKGTGWLIVGPVIFYVFPDWPQWIAKLFPTYWFIDPIYGVSIRGDDLADVGWKLLIALGVGLALVPVVGALAKRMRRQLATG